MPPCLVEDEPFCVTLAGKVKWAEKFKFPLLHRVVSLSVRVQSLRTVACVC